MPRRHCADPVDLDRPVAFWAASAGDPSVLAGHYAIDVSVIGMGDDAKREAAVSIARRALERL